MTTINTNKVATLIKFPVISFRKIESPYDSLGIKNYIFVVDVKNLSEEITNWKEVNVRDANLNSRVARIIRESLTDDPGSFFFKNRGLTLLANTVRYNNKENIAEVEMVDKRLNGLLDGGHTYAVIMDYLDGLSELELEDIKAYIKIEVLEGIKNREEVVEIVEARNTSEQVKKQSIDELLNKFDEIKKVLDKQKYSNRISYKEYESPQDDIKKDIDVKEILSYLICFDVETFNDQLHPIRAYSTKSAVLDHFDKKGETERMSKYVQLLPQILELKDIIYSELPDAYNKGTGGKFGRLTGVIEVSNRRMGKVVLPFTGIESHYRIPSGFIYPVLAAFRNLVKCDGNHCQWITNPIKIFRDLRTEIAKRVGEQAKELRNPNKLGKDTATWRGCYDVVEKEVLKRHII